MTIPEIRPGQIWADNDPRSAGRTLQVDEIIGGSAFCTILTNSNETQRLIDIGGERGYLPKDNRGKRTRIKLARFKPVSTGYRLLQSAPAGGTRD